jgi:hypothetical protein
MVWTRGEDDEDHCLSLEDFVYMDVKWAFNPSRKRNAATWWPIGARA